MTSLRRKKRRGKLKIRLPLPAKGPQVHKDRRHESRKYATRNRSSIAWRELLEDRED